MKYESGAAFRRAIEDRLRIMSLAMGVPLVRLRKMVAFDRFLSRLFSHEPDHWVVKGGFALQLRLGDRARTTKKVSRIDGDCRTTLRSVRNDSQVRVGLGLSCSLSIATSDVEALPKTLTYLRQEKYKKSIHI